MAKKRSKKQMREKCEMGKAKVTACVAIHWPDDPFDQHTSAVDLLTDVMHYCEGFDVDFEEALRIATDHFEAEQEGL